MPPSPPSPQAPPKQGVSVVLSTQDTVETRELPLGYTAQQLREELKVSGESRPWVKRRVR